MPLDLLPILFCNHHNGNRFYTCFLSSCNAVEHSITIQSKLHKLILKPHNKLKTLHQIITSLYYLNSLNLFKIPFYTIIILYTYNHFTTPIFLSLLLF